jgi:hypothetical protein
MTSLWGWDWSEGKDISNEQTNHTLSQLQHKTYLEMECSYKVPNLKKLYNILSSIYYHYHAYKPD